jgi:hypothetical protein
VSKGNFGGYESHSGFDGLSLGITKGDQILVRGLVSSANQPFQTDGNWFQEIRLDVDGCLSSETVPLKQFNLEGPIFFCKPGREVLVEFSRYCSAYGMPVITGVRPNDQFYSPTNRQLPKSDMVHLDFFERPAYRANACKHQSLGNDRVSSKSEVIISNILYHERIPYHYEMLAKSKLGQGFRYPDWMFFDSSKNPVIWEHLGMLSDAKYREDWLKKAFWYDQHGVVYGTNLFITRDDENGGINSHVVLETCAKIKSIIG